MGALPYPLPYADEQTIKKVVERYDRVRMISIRKTYLDFSTAALTLDRVLFKLPAAAEILTAWMSVLTAFAGTASYTMSLGPNGAETTLQTAQSVASTGLKLAAGTDFTTNRAIYSASASTDIEARATSTVNNLDAATAGVIVFYFAYIEHPRYATS